MSFELDPGVSYLDKPSHFVKKEHVKPDKAAWEKWQMFLFRVAFLFFSFFTVSFLFDINYYKSLFSIDLSNLHIRDLSKISPRGVNFVTIDTPEGRFGLASYVNWAIVLFISIVGASLWSIIDARRKNYSLLSYFIQVAVRYTIIMQITGLTFSKIFPSQMPPLSLGQLHNELGDFTAQKLYWTQLSFVPSYEITLGFAELAIMTLLFFRRTAVLGGALALAMVGNIAIANHVYDGEVHLLAAFHAIGGAFILMFYFPKIWSLLVKRQDVELNLYHYPFRKKREKWLRYILKFGVFAVFFALSAWLHFDNYKNDSYKVPARAGLEGTRGFYNVKEFWLNGKLLPYSPMDSVRWQYAIFEDWSTLSYKINKQLWVHNEAGRGKQFHDVDRTFESAGQGGGKVYYYYEADTLNHTMKLKNKNKLYIADSLLFYYHQPSQNQIILEGLNETKDSIKVVLFKSERNYPIFYSWPDKQFFSVE